MKVYIRTEIVQAEPMTERYFREGFKGIEKLATTKPGYKIIRADNSISWFPKEVFEAVFHEINMRKLCEGCKGN